MRLRGIAFGLMLVALSALGGCMVGELVGGMAQSAEYQKLVDMPPRYNGLENKTVAVIVDVDLSTLYEFPNLAAIVTSGVGGRIARDVPGARVLPAQYVINWQYRSPQWAALPYGEMAAQLNVERIVVIQIQEYRLNPPGNRYIWDGVANATVGIVERNGLDPDSFAEQFEILAKFPNLQGVSREEANKQQIEAGLLAEFIKKTAWLFHQHLEPKYPDKYRPEINPPPAKS